MIIVGNGTSILDKPLGSEIDSHQEVLRFNDYRLKKEWTGEKITHWWNTVNYQNLAHENLLRPLEECCLHSWDFKDSDKLWARLKNSTAAKKVFKSREEWIKEIQDFAATKHYAFSTGLLAIWRYLKDRDVTIHGFDWWARKEHHPFDNAPRGTIHDPELEKKIIDKLCEEKGLKWLIS